MMIFRGRPVTQEKEGRGKREEGKRKAFQNSPTLFEMEINEKAFQK